MIDVVINNRHERIVSSNFKHPTIYIGRERYIYSSIYPESYLSIFHMVTLLMVLV